MNIQLDEETQDQTEQVLDSKPEGTAEETPRRDEQVDNSLEIIESITKDQAEEPEDLEETEVEDTKDDEDTEVNKDTIPDELVSEFNSLKALEGKSLKDMAKSYDNLVKELTKTKQELSKLNKQEELIDPIEDPEGFARQMEEKAALKAQQAVLEREQVLQQVAVEEAQFITDLSKELPQDVDPRKAILSFRQMLPTDEKGNIKESVLQFYSENPKIFKENVISHIHRKINDKTISKEAKEKAYELVKNGLSKSTKADLKSSVLRDAPELSETDKMAAKLIELSFDKDDWQ